MKMTEVKAKAAEVGIKAGKMKKDELIRAIQNAEGNFPCFGTANGYCDQDQCSWRDDCMSKN